MASGSDQTALLLTNDETNDETLTAPSALRGCRKAGIIAFSGFEAFMQAAQLALLASFCGCDFGTTLIICALPFILEEVRTWYTFLGPWQEENAEQTAATPDISWPWTTLISLTSASHLGVMLASAVLPAIELSKPSSEADPSGSEIMHNGKFYGWAIALLAYKGISALNGLAAFREGLDASWGTDVFDQCVQWPSSFFRHLPSAAGPLSVAVLAGASGYTALGVTKTLLEGLVPAWASEIIGLVLGLVSAQGVSALFSNFFLSKLQNTVTAIQGLVEPFDTKAISIRLAASATCLPKGAGNALEIILSIVDSTTWRYISNERAQKGCVFVAGTLGFVALTLKGEEAIWALCAQHAFSVAVLVKQIAAEGVAPAASAANAFIFGKKPAPASSALAEVVVPS